MDFRTSLACLIAVVAFEPALGAGQYTLAPAPHPLGSSASAPARAVDVPETVAVGAGLAPSAQLDQAQALSSGQDAELGSAAVFDGAATGAPANPFSAVVNGDVEINDKEVLDRFIENVAVLNGSLSINIYLSKEPLESVLPMDLVFPKLERVTGGVIFGGRNLRSLDMPKLSELGSDGLNNLYISMASYPQPDLVSVKLPRLRRFAGEIIDLDGAPKLTRENVHIPDAAVRAKVQPRKRFGDSAN